MTRCLVVVVLLLFLLGTPVWAEKLPVLAVVGFGNHSSVQTPDLGNMGLQVLESTLLSMGQFTLADRLTVENSLTEIGFSSASGLVDPAYAIQLGKMLGAKYLAMGDVVEVVSRTTEFQGYGIRTQRTAFSVTVALRVVDAERGAVLFVDQETRSRESLPLKSLGVVVEGESLSVIQSLMREAIETLVARFQNRLLAATRGATTTGKKVKVMVDSSPQGADVELGGIFYGNTPCELLLEEDTVVEITVSLPGYIPWAKRVKVAPDLRIKATLKEDNVSKVEVKVKEGGQ